MGTRGRGRQQDRDQRIRDKLAELDAHLAVQTQRLSTADGWRDWVDLAARFPHGEFSVTNLLLIGHQDPAASAVANYQGWQSLGRQVSKDERGLAILTKDRDSGAAVPAYVFDVSQTQPHPDLPPPSPRPDERLSASALRDSMARLAVEYGVAVPDAAGDVQAVSALARVLGRHLLAVHHPPGERDAVEAETEAVSYLVLRAHGLTDPPYSGPAITASSASELDGVTAVAAAERVLTASRVLLAPTHTAGRSDERGRELLAHGRRTLSHAAALAQRAELSAAITDRRASGRRGRSLEQVGERDLFPTRDQLERLAAVNVAAAAFYREQLVATPPVRDYLRARVGDGRALPRGFVVGYAPPGWTALLDHLRASGFADRDLLDAGVVQQTRRGTLIDRFRDRVLVGLRDEQGRLAGFIGRTMQGDGSDAVPKYLNTCATALFDKGRVLLGLHEQRQALADGAVPVLVEGPFDVLAVTTAPHNEGRVAPVATSGTAVSAQQVAMVLQAASADTVVLAHDGDAGGREATLRTAEMMLPLQRDVRAAELPDRHDPASWAREYPEQAVAPYLDDGRTRSGLELVIDARIETFGEHLEFVDGRVDAMRHAVRVLGGQPPQVVAEQALRIARRLDLDPVTVAEEIGEVPKSDRAAQRALARRAQDVSADTELAPGRRRRHPAALAHLASPSDPAVRGPVGVAMSARPHHEASPTRRAGDERGR
jgi:DNA primase